MARKGDTIENPVTGERITFLAPAGDTDGELLQFDLSMPPGVGVPLAHYHLSQEERFELVSGGARFRVGRKKLTAQSGDTVVVPPGVRHRFWNDGDEELRVLIEFRPALRTEQFFEQLWHGPLTRRGIPRLRLMIEMAPENYLAEVYLARIPRPLQQAVQRVLAVIARALG